jgi:hypothetical protein
VAEQSAATGWTVGEPLTEDQQYFWRVRAWDGFEYSDYSVVESFWVNAVNQPPQPFSLLFPADKDTVFESHPLMSWQTSLDTDPNDLVLYALQVSTDEGFGVYTEYDHLDVTSVNLPLALEINNSYYWRVKANDLAAAITWSSETFVMHTAHSGCCIVRGDINNSGAGPDVSDLVFLVSYMFQEGPEPPCPEASDVNGVGASPDISDLVYLVSYMFQGGAAPVPCP